MGENNSNQSSNPFICLFQHEDSLELSNVLIRLRICWNATEEKPIRRNCFSAVCSLSAKYWQFPSFSYSTPWNSVSLSGQSKVDTHLIWMEITSYDPSLAILYYNVSKGKIWTGHWLLITALDIMNIYEIFAKYEQHGMDFLSPEYPA